ncbi:MAG: hypothetical protein QF506_03590 [Candidatus Woesearchaeota archaeon]|jgi:tetratricopeptide (TPR) repeat protein|nr:hypothetical protein [Candidatus Woesearchaeota archaeon]
MKPGQADLMYLLRSVMSSIRLNDVVKIRKEFSKLLKIEKINLNQPAIRDIYKLGEVFSLINSYYYIKIINSYIKNKKTNYLLRLIRQEIMYNNSKQYDREELFIINEKDLKEFPNDPEFLNFKGLFYLDKGEYEKAIRYIDYALELDSKNVNFIRNKALILVELKEYDKARREIEYALGIEPDYEKLIGDLEYVDTTEKTNNLNGRLEKIEKEIKSNAKFLKNIKFDFIAVAGLFVTFLTLVIRIITFEYS